MSFFFPSWVGTVPWMHLYVGFSLTLEAFEQFLNIRQMRRYSINTPPKRLESIVTPEEYAKSNAYNKDRMKFSIFSSIFNTGISLAMTVLYVGPWCWRVAGSAVPSGNEYLHSLAFLGLTKVASEVVSLPFEIFSDFVIEAKHGFNKKTVAIFIKDKILGLCLTAAIGAPVTVAVLWLIKWGGPNFYLWLWGFSVFLTFFMMIAYPNLIAPLFNKFEPLKDEELKEKIEALAKRVNFPLTKLYQVDGSKRSSHSNAYFYGFWRWKRIVLYDTLLNISHDEIIAILGHELGHWKRNHMMKTMALSFANMFGIFYLFGLVMNNDQMYDSFGYTETRASIIGFMLFGNLLSPYNVILGMVMTLISRKNEFEADAFACELNFAEPLKRGLIDIHTENKSSLDPDPWFSWWHYSHPPLLERLKAIEEIEEKTAKKE